MVGKGGKGALMAQVAHAVWKAVAVDPAGDQDIEANSLILVPTNRTNGSASGGISEPAADILAESGMGDADRESGRR